MKTHTLLFCTLLPLALGACATAAAPGAVSAPVPALWSAPLPPHPAATLGLPEKPHHGKLTDLTQWWQQQGDPLLVELIAAAQAVSPTVATARSRLEQSRATRVAAGAALGPSLDASASVNRGRSLQTGVGSDPAPIVTTTQGGLQASWEIDVFGGNRAERSAAEERLAGAVAECHEARE